MKKSNKILLGGFLTVIILVTGIHFSLYAKYKNGHYTVIEAGDRTGQSPMQSFPGVSVITFLNIQQANILFGDVMEVEKNQEDEIQFSQNGDSLTISRVINDGRLSRSSEINFTVPSNVSLSAINSYLYISKGKEDSATNAVMTLKNSNVQFLLTRKPIQLGNLKVIASDKSVVAFFGNPSVKNLELQLQNSSLIYREGEIGQLSIASDTSSSLELQSKHLLKAKLTAIPATP